MGEAHGPALKVKLAGFVKENETTLEGWNFIVKRIIAMRRLMILWLLI